MDPRINLVGANLAGLPPVTIVAAQIDPLRSEGALLADRMSAAGVSVDRREYAGVTHEFFGADGLIPAAAQAQQYAGQRLRSSLWGTNAPGMAMPMPPASAMPMPSVSPMPMPAGQEGAMPTAPADAPPPRESRGERG